MRIEKCCALCGRDHSEVKRMILGTHGGICPECVYRCMAILQPDIPVTPPQQPAT